MSNIDTSSWMEFKLESLFEKIQVNKLQYKVKELPKNPIEGYSLPALTAGVDNQGLSCYVPREGATILKNCISVSANGANTGAMFYQPNDFTVLQDSYALKYKHSELSEKEYLFLIAIIQTVIEGNYDWSNKAGWERIKSITIKLPVTETEEIDFEYMEERIKELEEERIKELEEEIRVMGLDDTKLTEEEEKALNTTPIFKTFKVIDLFDVVGTKPLDEGKLTFTLNGTNFVGRVGTNNGVKGKIPKQVFAPNESNTFTVTVIGNYKYVFFQEEKYYCSQNINKLTPKFYINRDIALYFSTLLHKFVSSYNGQQSGYKLSDLKEFEMLIPTTLDGNVDLDYIQNYIRSIEKLTVQKLYNDKGLIIEETKKIVK